MPCSHFPVSCSSAARQGKMPARRRRTGSTLNRALAMLFTLAFTHLVRADTLHVATATNFLTTLEKLEVRFESLSGHQLVVSAGSSGSLYAQIINGAPYEVFLSADAERPARLLEQRPASHTQTYAIGRIALWWPGLAVIDHSDWESLLSHGDFRHLAMANPKLAPYGLAAQQTLQALQLDSSLQNRLVLGENIGQAYSLVASGNAELGFVAWSQLQGQEATRETAAYVLIPPEFHAPIQQVGIVLKPSPLAEQFMAFLRSEAALNIIVEDGYSRPGHD